MLILQLYNKSLFFCHEQQPRLLHVGQCLPKACHPQDVTTIMNADPSSVALQQKAFPKQEEDEADTQMKTNELNIFETRIVPGEYNIWKDQKLYVFG
jgi:hypothetical protein